MLWLAPFAVALIVAVLGIPISSVIASLSASWYSIPSREGASGYFVLAFTFLGCIASLIVGFIAAVTIAGMEDSSFWTQLGGAVLVQLVIALIVCCLSRWCADVAPTIAGRRLELLVEFRFPNSLPQDCAPIAPDQGNFYLAALEGNVQKYRQEGKILHSRIRLESNRWTVPASVSLFTELKSRVLWLEHEGKELGGFLLPLPRHPSRRYQRWSDWYPRCQPNGHAWPEDRMSYRFRIRPDRLYRRRRVVVQSAAEWEQEQARLKESNFQSLGTDSPITEWFPYIEYPQPQTERALLAISQRPGLIGELSSLCLGEDAASASSALRCIGNLPRVDVEVIDLVHRVGRDLVTRIEKWNVLPVSEDPGYQGAADISLRFCGWIDATIKLRKDYDANFCQELQQILELSRLRTDSYAMQADVRRVASYYLKQWAGIEPLSSDPKPR